MKRAVDIVGAGVALLLTSPILVAAAAAIRLTSRGPTFFRHVRLGRGGRTFHCYKLRTMVDGAERRLEADPELRARHRRNGFKLATHEDPRVTPVGRFLRRTHLDELPQLWNVLVGDMSLVGPRPIVREELAHYGPRAAELLSVRPGIFGEWTSAGRARVDYPERVEVELSYLGRSSTLGDLLILLRHLPVLARGQEPLPDRQGRPNGTEGDSPQAGTRDEEGDGPVRTPPSSRAAGSG